MKRVLMVAVLAGMGVMVGCEEKKADSVADKAKQAAQGAADKAKDAGTAMKDAAAGAADKAKDMGNVAADKLKAEVKNLMDTIKGKVDTLDKGGSTLEPAKKGEFDKAMAGIKTTWTDMSKSFDGLSGQTSDAMAKTLADLKDKGTKLLDTVKLTAEKFGIKLG
jgi:hypothetical protein